MSYKHLTLSDREVIKKLVKNDYSYEKIAKLLGVHKSTVSRELARNRGPYWYQSYQAHELCCQRRKQSKKRKIDASPELKDYIIDHLEDSWSPDIISGRMKKLFKGNEIMKISHEAIYLWIYAQEDDLYRHLSRGIPKRQRRTVKNKRRIQIPDRKSIHDRPASVETRKQIGHWEGDTIVGKKSKGYIATMAERKSKLLAAALMLNKRPETCNRSILEAFGDISNNSIKTITLDNGSEFFKYKDIEIALECNIYFADPYSSWQRGTNEHINGMLRRYFPKSMNFMELTQNDVDKVVNKLNNRPRKSLDYRTPFEVFNNLKTVALQP